VDEDGEPFDVVAFFDPDYGPPEGADAWLARVASPVADEYLAAHQPAAGAGEVLAAGFTHRDREPGARGWAAGGALDVMEPGPVLAGFADDAVTDGLAGLGDDELIGVLCAARRRASRAAATGLAAVAGLSGRREAYAARTRDRRQADHAGDEVAAALRLTGRAADKLLALAVNVARLPAVLDALAAGRIDLPRAGVYAPGLATGELGALLRRLVLAHDPDAARKKRQRAGKDARVETWAEPGGTAALAGRDLPPGGALAAGKNIGYWARQLKKAGTPATLGQLRAQVFTALLTSQPLYTMLPGNNGGNGNGGGEGENATATAPARTGATRQKAPATVPAQVTTAETRTSPARAETTAAPARTAETRTSPAPAETTAAPARTAAESAAPDPAPGRPAAGPRPASRQDPPDRSTSPSRYRPGSA
jgi:hypothetical protein